MEYGKSCGDCYVCCESPKIKLSDGFYTNKPEGVICKYVEDDKCSIYENRFDVCKKYECFWLQAAQELKAGLPIAWRPRNLGVCVTPQRAEGKNVLFVKEIYKGAADIANPKSEVNRFLQFIYNWTKTRQRKWEIYLVSFGTDRGHKLKFTPK